MSETSSPSAGHRPVGGDPLESPVGDLASRPVVGCAPEETLLDAAAILSANAVHALVVLPPDRPAGSSFAVLSDQDLLEAVALGRDPAAEQAGSIAGTEPVTIDAGATVREAAAAMREHEVSHLFVVDPATGGPVGVVSSLDVARVLVRSAPSASRAGRIVLGHDGGPGGDDAAALAALLAAADGAVHAVIAIPFPPRRVGEPPIEPDPGPGDWDRVKAELEAKGADVLERRALSQLRTAERRGEVVMSDSPSATLTAIGETELPDCIVVGSSRRGRLGTVLIGSTGQKLAHGSAVPVAIAPRGYADSAPERIATIAVGFDGGGESDHALELAASIARRHGAALRIIGVLETTIGEGEIIAEAYDALSGKPVTDRRKQELETRIAESVGAHAEDLSVSVEIERGRVADRLISACDHDADLLVVGSRGYGPLARVLLGSTSSRLAGRAPCPLLVATRRSH